MVSSPVFLMACPAPLTVKIWMAQDTRIEIAGDNAEPKRREIA